MTGRRGRRPLRRLARKRLAGGARCAPPSARPLPRGCHRLPRRGQDPSLRTIIHGCFVGSGLDRSAGWADVYGWPVGAAYMPPGTPCAAANTPGGINPSPTHCPQTTACMAGRRGRRPLRRLARKRLPAVTPRAGHCGVVSVGPRLSGAKPGSEQCLPPRGKQPHERASFAGWRRSLFAAKRPAPTTRRKTAAAFLFVPPGTNSTIFIIYYFLFIICTIRGMIYLTPISITKRSDPF